MSNLIFHYDNISTEIDNLLLTKKALYVIEAKDYSGYIFGSSNQRKWTQTFVHRKARTSGNTHKSGVSKYQFYNPIKQNATHIHIINQLTNIASVLPVKNIVVFGNSATLREVVNNTNAYVVSENQLYKGIIYLENRIMNQITNEKLDQIYKALMYLSDNTEKSRQDHIKRVDEKYKS